MPDIGTCKLRGCRAKLLKAHIVPNSFYRPMMKDSGYAMLVTNQAGQYNRRLSTGIYDSELVCSDCEAMFSPWDDYGKRILLDTDWKNVDCIPKDSRPQAYEIPDIDYAKLKLFFMSVLWRMAATSRREFDHVDLEGYLEPLREAVAASDPGSVDDWTVCVGRFESPHSKRSDLDPRQIWLDPHRTTLADRKCVKMYLAEFTVYLKLERQCFPSTIRMLSLAPDQPFHVIVRDFEKSSELRLVRKMSRTSQSTPRK